MNLEPTNAEAGRLLPEAPGSAASSQYLARWLPEDGGKAVIVGDWHEVLTAATLFMEMGANKIEIETVRAMPPNDKVSDGGPLTHESKQDANPPFAAPLG